ncbi:hypothetical protein ACFL5Z_04200 [Planctomycetota bacterium]
MNTEKRIEQCLKAAPKPSAPDGLLGKLHKDITLGEMKARHSVLRKWLAPAGGSISLWRVAAAAAIAIAVLLPLSYGATKAVKHFILFEATFEYPQDDGAMHAVKVGGAIGSNDPDFTEEDARESQREFYELYKQGKAEEIEPGFWFATLSNGHGFGTRNPEMLGLSEAELKEFLKKQADEINELRKAGKYEKIYKPEHDFQVDGVKHRFYFARYILSDGTVKTVGSSEPVKDEE